MGKKGKKTRWRKLPIALGEGHQHDDSEMDEYKYGPQHHNQSYQPPLHHQQHQPQHRYQQQSHHYAHQNHQPAQTVTRSSFNEDEYTKITTPRQDMLFKKGYLGKKRATSNPPQDVTDNQSAGSVESENYACEEPAPQYVYPYVDSTGAYYFNAGGYEVYDPYTGAVAVIFGPGPGYGHNASQPILAAVPCQPVPLQPVEWFSPMAQQSAPAPLCLPSSFVSRKKRHSVDSQNCSGQSSESNCPLGSPQEPVENVPEQNGVTHSPQYVYPCMFGAPVYNVNGVNVQGLVPPPAPPPADPAKRRKKRKRRKRGGAVTDEGSESSCEEANSCEANGESQSGASSDTAVGSSSSSKTNSDSGIQTDPAAYSGTDSPQIPDVPPLFPHPAVVDADTLQITTEVPVLSSVAEMEPELSQLAVDDSKHIEVPTDVAQTVAAVTSFADYKIEQVPPLPALPISVVPVEDIKTSQAVEDIVETTDIISDSTHVYEERVFCESEEIVESYEREEIEVVNEIVLEAETPTSKNDLEENNENNGPQDLDERLNNLCLKNEEIEKIQVVERPITDAVTKWLQSQGTSVLSTASPFASDSDDEGIEEGEDALDDWPTGQKNGLGNPCLASSPSDAGSRVAQVETEIDDNDVPPPPPSVDPRVRDMCNPRSSVNKYYRLADERLSTTPSEQNNNGHVFSSTAPVILKTAVHIGRSGPFPCGICCMIQ